MKHKLSAVLLILVISGCVYGFLNLFERDEKTEDLGWDQAALRNPYLAAEFFLRRLGTDVQSYDRFGKLDFLPENGTLFVSDSRHVVSRKWIDQLTRWIKRGGHLIVAAAAPGGSETDRLLASFAIENRVTVGNADAPIAQPRKPDVTLTGGVAGGRPREDRAWFPQDALTQAETGTARTAEQTEDGSSTTLDAELSELQFSGIDATLKLHFKPSRTLYHPDLYRSQQPPLADDALIYWAGNSQRVHFMQLEVEQGLLSVLSDGALWQSDQIDKFDHAFFLRTLARDRNGVRLLYGIQMPSLCVLIWRRAAPLVIASALWLGAWLLYRGRRFSPIVQPQTTVRRSIAEHIVASVNYLWRGGYRAALLAPVRDDIQRQACRTVAHYDQLDDAAQDQCLSMYAGIPLGQIENAMRSDGKQHEDHFVETIQCLQQIKKSL